MSSLNAPSSVADEIPHYIQTANTPMVHHYQHLLTFSKKTLQNQPCHGSSHDFPLFPRKSSDKEAVRLVQTL